MKDLHTIQIHFVQNLRQNNSVDFDINSILLALKNNNYINILLNKKKSLEDINLLLVQLTKYLTQNEMEKYNYTFDKIVWGECLRNGKQVVMEVTYYLYNSENHE